MEYSYSSKLLHNHHHAHLTTTDISYSTSSDDQRLVKIATCTLNQWAMDFEGNKNRIIESIIKSREQGANIRIGPELEIPGYGCEDHFLELDTINHSWDVLSSIVGYKLDKTLDDRIIENYLTYNIICDIGIPVMYQGIIYNCRAIVYNCKIIMIRPKMAMSDDGNYRENRWFTPWNRGYTLENFILPEKITKINNQTITKFGIGIITTKDLSYATEICEELWVPQSPSTEFSKHGCEIIGNSSGSHFQINKQERRYELILNSCKKNGGAYVYSNFVGCDGGRLYFDGGSLIAVNGKILAEGSRFMLNEIEIITATIDLNEVASYRSSIKSRCLQSSAKLDPMSFIYLDEYILKKNPGVYVFHNPFESIIPKQYSYEEEMCNAPVCWLWDYLRRSGASGFFLALSGGADSSCVAVIVSLLTRMIYTQIVQEKNEFVLKELRKIIKDDKEEYYPKSSEEICNLIFVTSYMGTKYSSTATRDNSSNLAKEIGSYHLNIDIDKILESIKETFVDCLGKDYEPKFISQGGTYVEDIALQNIQARVRMVLSYMLASLVSWTRQKKGYLLVLASGNLDEGITGYLTKYDCSSADINPIGSLSKIRLKKFLEYCYRNEKIKMKSLEGVLKIEPSAELRPVEVGKKPQTDEEDMGLTYEELSTLGQLRKDLRCGPYSMFKNLVSIWRDKSTSDILNKVKLFFRRYSVNRHKMTTITPSLHIESYSIDDNRYDLRQFLYNTYWTFQFNEIEKFAKDETFSKVLKI
jgi:NAD+ synthase (glutamine-hydrolysing)